jgi:hypothetical protein
LRIERYANYLRSYVDGGLVGGPTACSTISVTGTNGRYRAAAASGQTRYFNDLYLTQAAIGAGAAFTPHAYEAGDVACSDTAFGGGTVSQVDWAVDSGSGTVTAVYLWTSGGWQQVGDANPTSPITGLAVQVPAGGSVVKVDLAPLAGGLQLVTPTLDWVQTTYTPTARTPLVILQSGQMRSY